MRLSNATIVFCLSILIPSVSAQVVPVQPQIQTKSQIDGKVTVLEVAAHFVTAIRMPETVNSVVVGDPSLFQVERSEEHTSELQSPDHIVCRLLLEKKKRREQ